MELNSEPGPAPAQWSEPDRAFADLCFDPSPYLHYYQDLHKSLSQSVETQQASTGSPPFD